MSRCSVAKVHRPPTIPNPKSTLPYPKSTLDLSCEELIWVENGLMPPPLRDPRHAFYPINTPPSWKSNRTQTVANQKFYFPNLDSGCETISTLPRYLTQRATRLGALFRRVLTKEPFYQTNPSSIVRNYLFINYIRKCRSHSGAKNEPIINPNEPIFGANEAI